MITDNSRVRRTTELQSALVESGGSAVSKYIELNIGQPGFWPLIKYELGSIFLLPMPGAIGYLLRSKLFSRMFRSFGKRVVMGRNICVRHPARISVGSGTILDDYCTLDAKGKSIEDITLGEQVVIGRNTTLSCKGGFIQIGDNSNISANCMIVSESRLEIGNNVLIAGMTYIVAGGNHGTERTDVPIIQQPMVCKGGISIEDNCWIGANATILDGVTIGRDTIVGAGAVVTNDLPPFSIAVGTPARVVKTRK